MSRNYKFLNPEGVYFISFAVVDWIDVFVRDIYCDFLVSNLNFCIKNKGMVLYGWCIMSNHVHLIYESTKQNPSGLIRDFKSYTSKELIKLIDDNEHESRKEWMMAAFQKAALLNSNNIKYQFWQQHNKPIELWSNKVIDQKLNYIHNNPVEAGLVNEPYCWRYSSAVNYSGQKGLIDVCLLY